MYLERGTNIILTKKQALDHVLLLFVIRIVWFDQISFILIFVFLLTFLKRKIFIILFIEKSKIIFFYICLYLSQETYLKKNLERFGITKLKPISTSLVSVGSMFTSNPRRAHWYALKCILRYLKGSL